MRAYLLPFAGVALLLSGCASAGKASAPARFGFAFKFLGGGQACQVTATDLRSKDELFVQVALPTDVRENRASYLNSDTGQRLAVKLVHRSDDKYQCVAAVAEGGELIATDSREQ